MDYSDMLYLERPVSEKHPPMPVEDRAAQFAPFAALTGYDSAIERTARKHEEAVAEEVEHVARPEDDWLGESADGKMPLRNRDNAIK